jgi:DNA-binding XRE family transcriptional regulator
MANNLGILRKEFNMTQNDLANELETSYTNIGYYEQEKRDFSTKMLIKLSDMFKASIDYILAIRNDGIYIYYDGDDIIEYNISEDLLKYLKEHDVIYYKNDSYKRYININKLLGIDLEQNLTDLMKPIKDLKYLIEMIPNLPLKSKDDLNRLYTIYKVEKLDIEKLDTIKKLLSYM